MADIPNEPKIKQTVPLQPTNAVIKAEGKPKVGVFKKAGNGLKSWVSWDSLKTNTGYVKENLRSLLVVQQPEHTESFAEAMKRLNLTETDIAERKASFLKLAIIIGSFGILTLLYTLYLLWQASFASAALAFVVTLLCLVTACRYHFWYFQTKNRKLGCTIKEWLNEKVSGEE